jgi:hypothetical protein
VTIATVADGGVAMVVILGRRIEAGSLFRREATLRPKRRRAALAVLRVSTVQIRPSPPTSLAVAAISGERREMAAFVARFERPTEPEREDFAPRWVKIKSALTALDVLSRASLPMSNVRV